MSSSIGMSSVVLTLPIDLISFSGGQEVKTFFSGVSILLIGIKSSLGSTPKAFAKALIIRTVPNEECKKYRDYNKNYHPYLSNDATSYIKDLGVRHLLIDTPSIDRYDDNGKLGNHHIFFKNNHGGYNLNTITELIFVPDEYEDGKYFLSIGLPNFKLDAAPSRPIIYKIK